MDDSKTNNKTGALHTLSEDEIVKQKESIGRRSALTSIGFGVIGAVAAAVGLRPAQAEAQGCTDSDSGPYADGAGYGRRCGGYYYRPRRVVVVRQPCTDNDGGPYADQPGYGRRCGGYVVQQPANCTDNDSGAYADAAGRGRRCGY